MTTSGEFKVPTSERELEVILKRAYSLAKKGQYADAIELCNSLIELPAFNKAGLRKRAAVLEHKGDYDAAMEDLENLVRLGSDEPADYYQLGLLQIQEKRYQEAVGTLTTCINICRAESFDYYLNPSLLLRAESHLRSMRFSDALADAKALPDGYQSYLYGVGVRTKEDIVADASRQLD